MEPKRGDIYFKSKEGNLVKAATTKVGALVYLNMKNLKDPEMVYSKLNAITPLDRITFNKLIAKINDPYEILKHKISRDEAEKIAILSLPGVGLEEERWRFYPADNLASHVLGFVAPTESEHSMEGQYGVEELYDTALRGASGKIAADKDANGLLIALSAQFKEEAAGYYYRAVNTGLYLEASPLGYQKAVQQMAEDSQKVLQLNPSFDEGGAYRILGNLYLKLPSFSLTKKGMTRDLDKARDYAAKALKVSPSNKDNRQLMAEVSAKLKRD